MRIAQRTNTRVRARFSPRANASVRLGSSFPSFLARSHFGGDRQLSSQVNLNAARSLHNHHHGNVCLSCPTNSEHDFRSDKLECLTVLV